MLLGIEGTRLQVELESEEIEHAVGENEIPTEADGVGYELDDECGEEDAGIAEGEEHVQSRPDCAENHADDPCSDRVDGNVDVEVAHRCSNLFWGKPESAHNQSEAPCCAEQCRRNGGLLRAHTYLRIGRVVLYQDLFDFDAFLGVRGVNGGIDLAELLQRQIRIQMVHHLEMLQRIQRLDRA